MQRLPPVSRPPPTCRIVVNANFRVACNKAEEIPSPSPSLTFTPFSSSTLLTFNMQATRKPSCFPFFLATEIILLEQWRRWVLLCLKRHVAPCSTNLWLGPSTPYRHSLLLKFLHISFFTYTEYMMIFLLFSGAPLAHFLAISHMQQNLHKK